ncbi:MAG: biotin carboxylase N-terminal domain-containing protein, partial [Alphaproteobacteria bacterium]
MFKKILIANRGEIACRIMATAQKMKIKTVAVYSDADANAPHVQMADEAVHIGAAPSKESYLLGDVIIQAALDSGAEAIHPGYGFLSENAGFVEAVKKAGLSFIGPDVRAISVMGDKIESKALAQSAGVSCVPGTDGAVSDVTAAVKAAAVIGYPVMVKASAGGGGKGMRVVQSEAELPEAMRAAMTEAANAFGDDRVFIEKFVVSPRHIEIQVLGDTHGHVVYLGERECSVQRRHQKVIEEAPSSFISEATRKAMGEQAVELAKAVDYVSAGTVEFIVGADQDFYFLEMNTRLQVEHPVTEQVYGLDLVEQMIRIAAGEALSLKQADITPKGWSIEARLYAEDSARGFLPSTGQLLRYSEPQGKGIRADSGVCEGGMISMFYDPMVAKLIASAPTRAEAIDSLRLALDHYQIAGVATNRQFL